MRRAVRWVAIVSLATMSAATARADDARRLDFAVLPGVTFASDIGFGLGINGSLYRRSPEIRPYSWSLQLALFATTRGVQDHMASLEVVAQHWRGAVAAGFFRDRFRPYYGIGNETTAVVPPGRTTDDYFTYDLMAPFTRAWIERRFDSTWRLALAYDLRWLSMTAPSGSLLEAETPTGTNDSRSARVDLEAAHDTRNEEASPTRGHFAAISGHLSAPWLGSQLTSGGLAGELRTFHAPLRPATALVVAGRLIFDATWGDIPVAQLSWFGGRSRVEGLGGVDSLRGQARLRYLGQAKVLGNLELRSRLKRLEFGPRTADFWAVTFFDVGRVWARVAGDGPAWRLHATGGFGLRIAWVKDFIARVDVGFGEGTRGFYASLDQLF